MERIHDCFAEDRLSAERKLEDLAERIRQTYPGCSAELCMGNPAEEFSGPAFQSRSGFKDYAPRTLSRLDLPRTRRMRVEHRSGRFQTGASP